VVLDGLESGALQPFRGMDIAAASWPRCSRMAATSTGAAPSELGFGETNGMTHSRLLTRLWRAKQSSFSCQPFGRFTRGRDDFCRGQSRSFRRGSTGDRQA
jgi:hypothetical protein